MIKMETELPPCDTVNDLGNESKVLAAYVQACWGPPPPITTTKKKKKKFAHQQFVEIIPIQIMD